MFDVLIDIAVLRKFLKILVKCHQQIVIGEENMIHYLEEVPAASLHMFKGYKPSINILPVTCKIEINKKPW